MLGLSVVSWKRACITTNLVYRWKRCSFGVIFGIGDIFCYFFLRALSCSAVWLCGALTVSMGFNNKFLLFIIIAKKNYGELLSDALPILDVNYGLMVLRTRLTYVGPLAHSNVSLLFRFAPLKRLNFAIFILVDNIKFRYTAIWLPRPLSSQKMSFLLGSLSTSTSKLNCSSSVHCLFYSSSSKGLIIILQS